MKNKKQQTRQAVNFLKKVCGGGPNGYALVRETLEKYDAGELTTKMAFRELVHQLQGKEDLVRQLNDFLTEDHRLQVLKEDQIWRMLEFVIQKMIELSANQEITNGFLDLLHVSSNKYDDMGAISYEEVGERIMDIVNSDSSGLMRSPLFQENLRRVIHEYIDMQERERMESLAARQPATTRPQERSQPEAGKNNRQAPPEMNGSKPKAKPHGLTPTVNGSTSLAKMDAHLPSTPSKEPSPGQMAEEPAQFNLKLESDVVAALRAKLTPEAFQAFARSLYLFSNSIISFQEMVYLCDKIFLGLERDLCFALREMVESRSMSVQKTSIFNIRNSITKSDDQPFNRKYCRIMDPLFGSEQQDDTLINKTFIGITSGQESTGNREEHVSPRQAKHTTEHSLFRVEDEMHEVDVTLAQLRVTLSFIERLRCPNTPPQVANKLIDKIAAVGSLELLYNGRCPQLMDDLRHRQPEVLNTCRNRLAERIQTVEASKKRLFDCSWSARVYGDFYKALDHRSIILKNHERSVLNNKAVIEQLKATCPGGALSQTWLSKLMGERAPNLQNLSPPPEDKSSCWNPVFAMGLGNTDLLTDAYRLMLAAIRQSKANNSEKTKYSSFLEKALFHYFEIPKTKPWALQIVFPENLNEVLREVERLVFPVKEYYLSDKVHIRTNLDNFKVFQDFSHSGSEDAENQQEISPNGNLSAAAVQEPEPRGQAVSLPPSDHEDSSVERSDVSRHFQQFIKSETSEEPDGNMTIEFADPNAAHRVFYGGYHFYGVYQYLMFVYERLNFVLSFAQASPAGVRLYNVFLDLLYLHMFGVLDESNYEDAVKMVFGHQGAVLLNFERIFQNYIKLIPTDDFATFVLAQSPHLFADRLGSPVHSEPVLFARTCCKLNDMNNKENKNCKSNSFNSFNNNHNLSGSELLKFEYRKDSGLFLVHKVRSLFHESRKIGGSNQHLIESNYGLLTRQTVVRARKGPKVRRLVANGLTYVFDQRRQELRVGSGEADDVLLTSRVRGPADARKQRILKKNKDRFHQLLKEFRSAKN